MNALALSSGLAALLLAAVLGEGGASPGGLLLVHGAVALLALLAILAPRFAGEPRLPAAASGSALALFSALALAGACLAPYRFAAFLVLQEIAAFAGVALLAARCGPRLVVRIGMPLLVGAALEGTLALVQRAMGALRPAGTFLNPNHLATWLVAALLIGAGTAGTGGRRGAWARVALAAPAALALVLVGSRAALLALVAGAVVLLLCLWRSVGVRTRTALAGSAALLLVGIGIGVAVRFARGDAFRYQRFKIYGASLQAVAASPWLGTGPGQFATAAANLNFPISEGPLRFARSFDATHSDLLRLPAEFGLPAAVAGLAALMLAAREIVRRRRSGALPTGTAGAIAALVALAVPAAVDNPSRIPALHLLAAALLGGLLSTETREPAPRPGRALRGAAAASLVLLVLVGDAAPYLAWKSVRGLPRGRLDASGRARLRAALAWNPFHPDLWTRRAEDLASGREFGVSVYAEAREAAETAVRLEAADARYRIAIARVEALACTRLFRDEAARARAAVRYDEAVERSCHDPYPLLEKGGFLLDASDPAGARRAAEQALRIEPEAVPARLLLAESLLAEGGAGARESAARLLAEAEARARRWAAWPKESSYEQNLLTLDPARARAIRERLERG